MAGRKPIPTALKIMRGNPGKRPLPKNEAKVKPGLPKAPAHLDEVAQAEWKRMGGKLFRAGLMTELDETALAVYCQAYSTWVEASNKLREFGAVLHVHGQLQRSIYVGISKDALDQMTRMLSEFGMTPSSRSRVKAEPPADGPSEFERFLRGDQNKGS